jgi:hypothetical protein
MIVGGGVGMMQSVVQGQAQEAGQLCVGLVLMTQRSISGLEEEFSLKMQQDTNVSNTEQIKWRR